MTKKFIEAKNTNLTALCFAVSDSKSWPYRCFFGWRETNEKGTYFIFSNRVWKDIERNYNSFYGEE